MDNDQSIMHFILNEDSEGKKKKHRTCSEEKNADVVYRARVGKLKVGVGFVDLDEVCLHETTGYAASEHYSGDEKRSNIDIWLINVGKSECHGGWLVGEEART